MARIKTTKTQQKPYKFCILLAAYNGEKWIAQQISSILNQKEACITIYISIDTSTDKTEEICRKLAKNNKRIIILPETQRFGSAAPNFFRLMQDVELSNYTYVAYADQDDIWNEKKCSRAAQELIKNMCDGYSSNVTAFWADSRLHTINKAQRQVQWDFLFESAGPGCTFVMTKKLALKIQSFIYAHQKEMLSVWLHDWFTYAFARSQGYQWYIDSYSSMLYRQHDNNQVGVNTGYKALLHRMSFVLSGQALKQSSLLATLCNLEKTSFVKHWHKHSRFGLLYLAFHAAKCRRKRSEKIVFFFSCLLLAIVGHNRS